VILAHLDARRLIDYGAADVHVTAQCADMLEMLRLEDDVQELVKRAYSRHFVDDGRCDADQPEAFRRTLARARAQQARANAIRARIEAREAGFSYRDLVKP
jgi:hypothetical protein